MYNSVAGGCCDCGDAGDFYGATALCTGLANDNDEGAWKPSGFCKLHRQGAGNSKMQLVLDVPQQVCLSELGVAIE